MKSRKARYILEPNPIGVGGYAEVFKATDRITKRVVALKRLASKDPESKARMQREIEVQKTIRNPYVIDVLDHSSTYQWYTMCLAKQVLSEVLLPVEDNLLWDILENCAQGLKVAHIHGCIHRDITPPNILQILDDNHLRWVVADWGLVRQYGRITLTRTLAGEGFGTLGFSSPETWEDAHNADVRADIYSLGRVAAFCATGKWPVPNMPLIPNGIWRTFVEIATDHNPQNRFTDMNEVLHYLLCIKDEKTLEASQFTNRTYETFHPTEIMIDIEEYIYQDMEINQEPSCHPVKAKSIIYQIAKETILTLSEKNMGKLSDLIHPQKGVRFSAYSWIDERDVVFTAEQIRQALDDNNAYMWGYLDGIGTPIKTTFIDYYKSFVYDKDFINADSMSYNDPIGISNTLNNAFSFYENSIIVEYHFIGFEPEYDGMDWESLRLAFQNYNETWYLVGIIHNCWTI